MTTIELIIKIFAAASGLIAATMSILLFLRLRWPAPALWGLKLFASALSPLFAFIGVLSIIAGLITGSAFLFLIGMYCALIFFIHIYRVTCPPDPATGFQQAFGQHWEDSIPADQKKYFLSSRSIFRLPAVPNPILKSDLSFAIIPGTDRHLLCDIWLPPVNIIPSGCAFIYLHGSAWYLLDKDTGTRTLFKHLTAQGHVIMDVAYRLAPETDMTGMVNDVKRAIVWMKENAGTYRVNPERIILAGGSAGGHLALPAAYTSNNPQFTPKELERKDTSVCAVISEYGPTDLEMCYYHSNQHLTTRSTYGENRKAVPSQMPGWLIKILGKEYFRLGLNKDFENAGNLVNLLGGHPDEIPEIYSHFSPVAHVNKNCPPTLLIQGEHDLLTQLNGTRSLHTFLLAEKVPVVTHILPQTDHAFDLALPTISPSAHNAFYDVERFIAITGNKPFENKPGVTKSELLKAG